jgi:hypothetical protein
VSRAPRSTGPARRPAPAPHAAATAGPPPGPAPAPLALRHPALWLVVLVCAAIVALSVTYDAFDPDQWQHLTVGRFIWEQHRFPTVQLWTWPTWGAPDVDYAWLFEALVWPLWKAFGAVGLFLWRWGTTLAAFALAWAAARRMGARGLAPLVVIALCAMVYRGRSQVRPETVAAVLLAAEVALLEARRHGARVPAAALVPIAWIWANTHISYYLFFVVLGVHVLAAHAARRRDAPSPRPLWLAGIAAAAISFVNPSGWRTLWQPFEFWLVWRHEPIYQTIAEMRPVDWSVNWLNGLPLLLVLWPALLAWRARHRFDLAELLTCVIATGTLLVGVRFIGTYSLLASVYLSRDLDEWVRSRAWPRWSAGAWRRAGVASAACLLVAWPEMSRPYYPIRVSLGLQHFPVAACDFIERHDLHGRAYNPFGIGGYLCHRFWPRRDQLPFMGIHQEGTREIRRLVALAQRSPRGWAELERRFDFDLLVLMRPSYTPDGLVGLLDRDTAWARVFGDDVALVYVRRHGPYARLAADSAYDVVPADPAALPAFGQRTTTDSLLRRRAEAELRREVAGSPWHTLALGRLANIEMFEARWDEARRDLEAALRIDPFAYEAREKLGMMALAQGRPREALRWFEEERRLVGYRRGLELRRAQVAQALGDRRAARDHYARELRRDPASAEARDSLESLTRRLGP